jgi:hypothetical protein
VAVLLAEEKQIIITDLSIMDPFQRAWFEKKQKSIQKHNS